MSVLSDRVVIHHDKGDKMETGTFDGDCETCDAGRTFQYGTEIYEDNTQGAMCLTCEMWILFYV
jgi:hypothetical protein